jgi:hypothetical protein
MKEQTLIEKLYNDFEIDPISFNYTDFEERVNKIVNVNVLEALERLKVEISKGENVYNHLEILQLIEIEITQAKV